MNSLPFKVILEGGPVMIPLAITSLVIWYLIIERLIFLRGQRTDTDDFMYKVLLCLKENGLDEVIKLCDITAGPLPRTVKSGLLAFERGKESVERVIKEVSLSEVPELVKKHSLIGILATSAPLLGLLGTVSGMVKTFDVISIFGTGDPQALAGGISEALVTTQTGLIIGIPGIIFYIYLSRRADSLIRDMDRQLTKFCNTLMRFEP